MSETNNKKKLFGDFNKIDKSTWVEKATKDLKGADFVESLIWQPNVDFKVEPYYTEEDLSHLEYLAQIHNANETPNSPTGSSRYWVNNAKIKAETDRKANADSLEALNTGADGIVFELDKKPDLSILLKGIHLEHCLVSFVVNQEQVFDPSDLLNYCHSINLDLNELKGSLEQKSNNNELSETFNTLKDLTNFRALSVTPDVSGSESSLSHEIVIALNGAIDYMDKLTDEGFDPELIAKNIRFSIRVGGDYFLEIAKLRALRFLFSRICSFYKINDFKPNDVCLHAISSFTTKTSDNPNTNILRNTTEAMAAILGGCNELTVNPHNETFEKSDAFSKRIALNISNILKEESYLDKVADPVAGSYYLENLTHELAKETWELFVSQ